MLDTYIIYRVLWRSATGAVHWHTILFYQKDCEPQPLEIINTKMYS